jgi:oligo-1,6-glucosidase
MGYDISDYKAIHAPYGSVADVERLIKELHSRGMKLLLDLVVNHTSDEHPWFTDSRKSKNSSKRDWYIWRPPTYDEDGIRKPPNNWKTSLGGGSVWEWDEASEEYYLHYYDIKQPGKSGRGAFPAIKEGLTGIDLNFENSDVREAVYDIMRFWLDKGCDGFRVSDLVYWCW